MRGEVQRGDSVVISAVDGSGSKPYPLAKVKPNITYETVSEQGIEPNQPLNEPLTFHGGLGYSTYDRQIGGCQVNTGILTNEPNVLRAPVKLNTVTLTDATRPPQYCFEADGPAATIAHDASSSGSAASVKTLTVSHTVGSNNNRILIAGVSTTLSAEESTSDTCTSGGVSLTRLAAKDNGTAAFCSLWYLVNPPTGAADVVFTSLFTTDIVMGVSSYEEIDLLNPFGSVNRANGTSNAPSVVITSASGELVIDVMAAVNPSSNTVGAGQTQRWNTNVASSIRGAGSSEPGAASVTMSWSLGSSVAWSILGVPLKQAAGPLLYIITPEPNEQKVYKVSTDDSNFGTLLNTRTFALAPTPPQGRPAEWYDGSNTQWRLPLGDTTNDIQSLTSIASGTSNDTWQPEDSGSGDADARHLKAVKNQLYRTTGNNEVSILDRNTSPSTESNWGDEFYVGGVNAKITDIGESGGISYIPKEDGLYTWDGVGEARRVLLPDDMGLGERSGQGFIWFHGGFLIPAEGGLFWTLTGTPVGPDSYPENRANHPSISSGQFVKRGQWMGLAALGANVYGLYVDSTGTSGKIMWGYESGNAQKPITWHCIGSVTADFNDFHGMHITHTSKFSASETRPCLWFANGNDVSYIWLDKGGAPMWRRGDIDLAASATVISGNMDLGYPRVPKQLRKISGWAEDFSATDDAHKFQFKAYLDGGSAANVGAAITASGGVAPDGYFERWFTQDTNDLARSLLIECLWTGAASLTDQNGPHLRDVELSTVAQPRVTRTWAFLFGVKDEQSRTATTVRSELEAYIGDLKTYKLPDNATFNGTMGDIRALRDDEISELTERGQEPPKYVFAAHIREMPVS